MKKLIVVVMLLSIISCTQEYEEDKTFSQAIELMDKKEYDQAIVELENIQQRFEEGDNHYFTSLFYLGTIYFYQKKYEEAEPYLRQVIDKQYNRFNAQNILTTFWDGDPFIYEQHTAAGKLAEIALMKKDYEKAKEYLDLFEKFDFPYGCGTMMLQKMNYEEELYSQYYIGIGGIKEAVYYSRNQLFSLRHDDEILVSLVKLLKSQLTATEIQDLKKELLHINIEKNEYMDLFFISIFGIEIDIRMDQSWDELTNPSSSEQKVKTDVEYIELHKRYIESSDFYKMLK